MHGHVADYIVAAGLIVLLILSFKEPPKPPRKLG